MACQRCYQKKIKCSGGDAARNFACRQCYSAHTECVYPTRHKNVTVSESYLKALESTVAQLSEPRPVHVQEATSPPRAIPEQNRVAPSSNKRRFIEDTTGDAFAIRLRNLASYNSNTAWTEAGDESHSYSEPREHACIPSYEYFSLPSDQPGKLQ